MRVRCQRHDLASGPDGLCIICRRQQAMARSEGGVAMAVSRRPNRIVVGVLLLIGLFLAWYWMRHDRLALELSAAESRSSSGVVLAVVRWARDAL
jgi:hypothetical protein